LKTPKGYPRPILTTERSVKIEGRKCKRRLDLAVVKRNNLGLRYIVEVKETGSPDPKASNIMKAITGAIKKLGKIRRVENNVKRRPVMIYFCRKLEGRYIDKALENELDDKIRKFNDGRSEKRRVQVLYGPLRPRNERL
jgi:hypothetical protein